MARKPKQDEFDATKATDDHPHLRDHARMILEAKDAAFEAKREVTDMMDKLLTEMAESEVPFVVIVDSNGNKVRFLCEDGERKLVIKDYKRPKNAEGGE